MYSKLHLCLTLLFVSIPGYRFDCKMSENDLDQCMLDIMIFGNDKAIVPTNDAEMDTHCKNVDKGVSCLKDYSKTCLSGLPQQAFGMLFDNLDKHSKTKCNNPKDRAEFIETFKCFIPKEKGAPIDVCINKHIKMVELASELDMDDHVAGSCCSYHLVRDCFVSNVKSICGDGHSQYFDEIFDDVASESVTFACSDFANHDKCASTLKPDIWAKLKAIDEATDLNVYKHGYKTPVKFILDMIKKFHS